MKNKSDYVITYLTEDGKEDVISFTAYSEEQARRYAIVFCNEHNYYLIGIEKACAYAVEVM